MGELSFESLIPDFALDFLALTDAELSLSKEFSHVIDASLQTAEDFLGLRGLDHESKAFEVGLHDLELACHTLDLLSHVLLLKLKRLLAWNLELVTVEPVVIVLELYNLRLLCTVVLT